MSKHTSLPALPADDLTASDAESSDALVQSAEDTIWHQSRELAAHIIQFMLGLPDAAMQERSSPCAAL